MAETLLAILLVTSSAKGTNLVFHWPPFPDTQPRLARPRPPHLHAPTIDLAHIDNVWLAATANDTAALAHAAAHAVESPPDAWAYAWQRPSAARPRSHSAAAAASTSRAGSRRASPSADRGRSSSPAAADEYGHLFGYPAEFLARILCPEDALCHQKFELVVDDLAFVGHPVCAEPDGGWRFKPDRAEVGRRGRGSRNAARGTPEAPPPPSPPPAETPESTEHQAVTPTATNGASASTSSQHTFHLVFVLDLPDPSSAASGNLYKYFHAVYEHAAFAVTAVLFQEQVRHRFVDGACDALGALREACFARGAPYATFVARALEGSELARALRTLHGALKARAPARLVLNGVGVEVQLPPALDALLHAEEEHPDYVAHEDAGGADADAVGWGPELSFGWGLPALAPWKSLLLFDGDGEHADLKANLARPGLDQADQLLAEGLLQFLETVSIFDSLAVVAHSLDWDLERQVYPTVRWLVYHRRAKIVDTVHRGLRTVFALPSKMERSLPEITAEFSKAFPQPDVPPLPKLFAALSNPTASTTPYSPSTPRPAHVQSSPVGAGALSSETNNHFFATVVRAKDLIPLYQDVVVWLLRHDLLVTLHLRVRIVATPAVKERVRRRREAAARRRFDRRMSAGVERERERSRVRGRERSAGRDGWAGVGAAGFGAGLGGSAGTGDPRLRRLARAASRSAVSLEDAPEQERAGGADSSFAARSRVRRFSSRSVSARSDVAIPEEAGFRFGDYRARAHAADDDDDGDDEGGGGGDNASSDEDEDRDGDEDGDESDDSDDDAADEWDTADDNALPSIIPEPGQATSLQRKWIEAMSEGKGEELALRFRQINQYFDGKRTDDEILYRAEITRRQLREVLHHYQEFLLTFLHPA